MALNALEFEAQRLNAPRKQCWNIAKLPKSPSQERHYLRISSRVLFCSTRSRCQRLHAGQLAGLALLQDRTQHSLCNVPVQENQIIFIEVNTYKALVNCNIFGH